MSTLVIRYVVIIVSILATGLWIWLAAHRRELRLLSIIPISYAAHAMLFGVVVHFFSIQPRVLNIWSSAIRLQGLILIIVLAIFCMREQRNE